MVRRIVHSIVLGRQSTVLSVSVRTVCASVQKWRNHGTAEFKKCIKVTLDPHLPFNLLLAVRSTWSTGHSASRIGAPPPGRKDQLLLEKDEVKDNAAQHLQRATRLHWSKVNGILLRSIIYASQGMSGRFFIVQGRFVTRGKLFDARFVRDSIVREVGSLYAGVVFPCLASEKITNWFSCVG